MRISDWSSDVCSSDLGGRLLLQEGDGIGLQRQQPAVGSDDLVLVKGAALQAGNEQLPDADLVTLAPDVAAAVPAVEVAHHAAALRVGRPDGEAHAFDAFDAARMRAALLEDAGGRPLGPQGPAENGGTAG